MPDAALSAKASAKPSESRRYLSCAIGSRQAWRSGFYERVAGEQAASSAKPNTGGRPRKGPRQFRNPHEAQRNAGAAFPDCATLHPGYGAKTLRELIPERA